MFILRYVLNMRHCAGRCKYQLIVVGGCEVGVSVGKQEQLAVRVNGEETKEVVLPTSNKISDCLSLRLRCGLAPAVEEGAAVR